MAETLVSKIVANAGKNWSRNTVADGNWLNANTIVKLNQNDKTLAEAIDSLSASMPHILPEYPGFKLDLASNETIKSIEQKTTGELVVEKQGIDIESSTLNDKLWAHLNTNDFKALNAEYSQLYYNGGDYSPQLAYVEPGSQGDGCTTTALGLSAGIYSIYLELSYKLAEQDAIEAIEKEVFIGLFNDDTLLDEISFHVNDTYKEMEQHRLVNAVVKFATDGILVIKGKTETGHVNGGLKINNLYIVSVGGATGPKGETGNPGADGFSPTVEITEETHQHTITITDKGGPKTTIINDGANGSNGKTPELTSENYHIKWKYTDGSNWTDLGDFRGAQGETGKSLSATSAEDAEHRRTQVKIGQINGSEQTSFYLPWGVDGANGITPSGSSERAIQEGIGGNLVSFKYNATGTDPRDFQFFVPDGQSTGATQIIGGQGIQSDKVSGEEKYTLTFSGGNFQNLSAASATRSERAGYADAAGGLLDEAHNNYRWAQQLISAYDEFNNNYKTYVTSAVNLFDTTHKYGLVKDNQGNVSWGQISEGSTYNFDNDTQGYHTLSGDGSTNPIGANTDVIPTKDWLDDNYLPLSGGTVSGSTYFSAANGQNMLAVASAATLIGASRQSEANFGQNNDAMGTTWIGVGGQGMYRGFLKYTQGGNVGDLDSNNTMQVEFTPSNKGQLFAKAKNNGTDCPETQILNPVKTTCDNMTTSGVDANNVSGPNYMIAKNADGQFVIGAAVFNCQGGLPGTLQPNTYYFVY